MKSAVRAFADPFSESPNGELMLRLPEGGIDPAWLARPLGELGLDGSRSSCSLHVEMPPSGRWSTTEAAFLARCVTELAPTGVNGLPQELIKLLVAAPGGKARAATNVKSASKSHTQSRC